MKTAIRRLIPRRIWRVARNAAARWDVLPRLSGTHDGLSADQLVAAARQYVEDYLAFGHLEQGALRGRRILEVGPGNNFCVALMLLVAHEAEQVTCVDRFRSRPNEGQAHEAYRRLLEQCGGERNGRVSLETVETCAIDGAGEDRPLVYLWDCGVEGAWRRLGEGRFDLILSRSVLEHVSDVPAAIDSMARMLRRGGRMIHRVDLRSHEEEEQSHPLDFLRPSPAWWRLMTSHTGEPNRERRQTYERALAASGLCVRRFETTHSLPREVVAAVRGRLSAPFRAMTDEELMVTGIIFDAERPGR